MKNAFVYSCPGDSCRHLFALGGPALHAAPAKAARACATNAPINISSDSFQADLNGKSGTWSGNVLVVQGDIRMHANAMTRCT